jgi:hypothetical protein
MDQWRLNIDATLTEGTHVCPHAAIGSQRDPENPVCFGPSEVRSKQELAAGGIEAPNDAVVASCILRLVGSRRNREIAAWEERLTPLATRS